MQQDHIVKINNYKLFCDQLNEAISKYPNLRIKERYGLNYLKGTLDIPDDEGTIVGSFLIELHFADKFPYRFPLLFETGGIIPNEADWHKYQNSSCCITVTAKEILLCRNGLSVISFIEIHAIAFFANFIYRKANGIYKNGDYGHGIIGLKQFYADLFKTNDQNLWFQYFKNVFRNLSYNNKRNEPCFCNSGKKFKVCHNIIFETLSEIGEKQVTSDLKIILLESYSNSSTN